MNTDRRTILALIATGRITPGEAERLLAAWNESRETLWILVFSLAVICLSQLNAHAFWPELMHFLNAQLPSIASVLRNAPTNSVGGLL